MDKVAKSKLLQTHGVSKWQLCTVKLGTNYFSETGFVITGLHLIFGPWMVKISQHLGVNILALVRLVWIVMTIKQWWTGWISLEVLLVLSQWRVPLMAGPMVKVLLPLSDPRDPLMYGLPAKVAISAKLDVVVDSIRRMCWSAPQWMLVTVLIFVLEVLLGAAICVLARTGTNSKWKCILGRNQYKHSWNLQRQASWMHSNK